MHQKWLKIYTTGEYYKAEIVRQVLTESEIEAVILNKQDSQYKFGEVEVHIPELHFQKAIEIIIQNKL